MEVGCKWHPGASTIGRQLLNETTPMPGKSWQPSHEPLCGREKVGTCHTDKTVSGKRREGQGGGNNL